MNSLVFVAEAAIALQIKTILSNRLTNRVLQIFTTFHHYI